MKLLQRTKRMLSALSSLIWGTEQEVPATENSKKNIDEHLEVENEWIYIQPKGKNFFLKFRFF